MQITGINNLNPGNAGATVYLNTLDLLHFERSLDLLSDYLSDSMARVSADAEAYDSFADMRAEVDAMRHDVFMLNRMLNSMLRIVHDRAFTDIDDEEV